jgi:iron(III) transport system permease protein
LTAISAAAVPESEEVARAKHRWLAPLWVTFLLAVLAFLVVYPLLMLLFGALSDSNPVIDGFGSFRPSIAHFLQVLANENVRDAFYNALLACGGGTALGAPANISVLTTYIFKLTAWSPPLYNTAAAVAILLMVVTAFFVWGQQKILSGRSFATVAGKAFRPRSLDLGPWRWFTFGIASIYLFVVVILPTAALSIAAFRKFLFIPTLDSLFDARQYSWVHFNSVFDNPLTMQSIWNSLEVGVLTAVIGGVLAFAIGYTIHRTTVSGRKSIDLLSTLPVAVPGLVVGVAYLWAWIGLPGGLYGTIWILVLAFVARFIPDTVKALSTSFLQIHRELEEAAWICGRGMLGTIRTVMLPLARPGVAASMTLLFVLSIRELGSSLFLYTSDTTVMSVLLLDYYEGGNTGKTAAFSLVQTIILAVLLGITSWLSTGAAQSSARTG